MKYTEALCLLVALGSALARPQSEGRASRLDDDWRPLSNYHYIRYLRNDKQDKHYNSIVSAINHNTYDSKSHKALNNELSNDLSESKTNESLSNNFNDFILVVADSILNYLTSGDHGFKVYHSPLQGDTSSLHELYKIFQNLNWENSIIKFQGNNKSVEAESDKNSFHTIHHKGDYRDRYMSNIKLEDNLFRKRKNISHFIRSRKKSSRFRRKRQLNLEETLDYDSEEDSETSSDSSSSEQKEPNELVSDESDDSTESMVEYNLGVVKVDNSSIKEDENEVKDMTDDDSVIVESFVSNSLSDLKSVNFDQNNPAHKHSVIVASPTHESLDDLILHHTGSSGVIHHHNTQNQNHRPSVILVQDAPEHLLPKPPPNYKPSKPSHHYPPSEIHQTQNVHSHNHNGPHRPQNDGHSPKPPYRPLYQYPSSNYDPTPEPQYVPISPPKPEPSYKPVYSNKPIHHTTSKPTIITAGTQYRPIYVQHSTAKPPPNTFAHDPVYQSHKPTAQPELNFEPVPIYQHYKPQDVHKPIYKPVYHYPAPEPEPEPVHVPIYQSSYPEPEPEPEFVHRPIHHYSEVHEPIYLLSSTPEPLPSPKPASPTESPLVQANTPLGPTLIFINQQLPTTPLPPPSPSPLNPVTISSGEPPPSIVLLAPLNDAPTGLDAPPPAPHCAPVYITHTQNIHTSADFKDDCSEVNIIINAPVASAVGEGGGAAGGGGDLTGSDEESDDDENIQEDDDPGGGGGGGGGLIIPAAIPIIAAAGAGGGAAAAAGAAGSAGTAGIVGGAAAASAGGSSSTAVTPRPSLPIQNAPISPTSSSIVQQAPPTPTKRPQTSMTLWDYLTSAFTSFAYPFWTIVFAPFSLLLASGLGVAALVFPWAFPRFWFGRGMRQKRRRRRRRETVPLLEFEPMISQLDQYAKLFETRLNSNFNFSEIFNQ